MAQAKQQIVKYQKGKHSFKVVCYPGSVLQYREGKLGISKVFQTDTIFTNVVRGDIASADDLRSCFGADISDQDILSKIIEEGEIEYSASERKKFMDDKLNEIVYHIHKNYIDPKTKLPHPIDRIKNAISSSKKKIQIDLKQDSKKQAQDIVKRLQGTIMFAKAIISTYKLTIKYTYDGKCKNLIHGIASNVKEDYNAEGCIYTIELTKGDMDSLMEALAKPTNGDYNLIEQGLVNNTTSPRDDGGNGTGNGKGKNKGEKKGKKKKKQSDKHGKRGQEIAEAQQLARQQQSSKGSKSSSGTMASASNNNSNESKVDDSNEQQSNNNGKKKKRKKNKSGGNSNDTSDQTQSEQRSNQTMASASSGDNSGNGKRKRKGKKDKNRQ